MRRSVGSGRRGAHVDEEGLEFRHDESHEDGDDRNQHDDEHGRVGEGGYHGRARFGEVLTLAGDAAQGLGEEAAFLGGGDEGDLDRAEDPRVRGHRGGEGSAFGEGRCRRTRASPSSRGAERGTRCSGRRRGWARRRRGARPTRLMNWPDVGAARRAAALRCRRRCGSRHGWRLRRATWRRAARRRRGRSRLRGRPRQPGLTAPLHDR